MVGSLRFLLTSATQQSKTSSTTSKYPMIGLKGTVNVRIFQIPSKTCSCNFFCDVTKIETIQIIDNTGALVVECVNVLKNKTSHGHASIGDVFVCVVQKARPISLNSGAPSSGSTLTSLKVKRGDVQRAVLVRSRKPIMRPDGRWIRFDDNAAVLVNKKNEMIGTRIGGVVSSDLRQKGWGKIVSLAPKVCHES